MNTIPLFPLPLVVFPNEELPLHIFEERFKQLIGDCLAREPYEQIFGVSLADEGGVAPIGCAVAIVEVVTRYDDGRLDILTVGRERYQMKEILQASPYPLIQVEFFADTDSEAPSELQAQAIALHNDLLRAVTNSDHSFDTDGIEQLSFALAHRAGLDPKQRQRLLELRTERERLEMLVKYFHEVLPIVVEREEIRRRVLMNGHFRKLPSPEVSFE